MTASEKSLEGVSIECGVNLGRNAILTGHNDKTKLASLTGFHSRLTSINQSAEYMIFEVCHHNSKNRTADL